MGFVFFFVNSMLAMKANHGIREDSSRHQSLKVDYTRLEEDLQN